jgi:hypothetical protein
MVLMGEEALDFGGGWSVAGEISIYLKLSFTGWAQEKTSPKPIKCSTLFYIVIR